MSYTIVALFGQSGAGKDTLLDAIIKMDCPFQINKIITTTTRPPRDYETEGIDYHFISVEEFAEKILSGEMLEATSFNDWFYGTTINDIKENMVNVGVFSPKAIECLLEDSQLDVLPIYVCASDKTRLTRQLEREQEPDCAEICRRFFTDKEDFNDISFSYRTINNDSQDLDWMTSTAFKTAFVHLIEDELE
jgi:guanylate kinase